MNARSIALRVAATCALASSSLAEPGLEARVGARDERTREIARALFEHAELGCARD